MLQTVALRFPGNPYPKLWGASAVQLLGAIAPLWMENGKNATFAKLEGEWKERETEIVEILSSVLSGVAPANQTKERSVHELLSGAFRNKSSICESCLFS